MFALWITLTLIIWGVGAAYPGYNPKPFQYRYGGKAEYTIDRLAPYAFVVFVVGLFSVPVVGLALIGAAIAGPAYGLFKLGQKLRARREVKGETNA